MMNMLVWTRVTMRYVRVYETTMSRVLSGKTTRLKMRVDPSCEGVVAQW